ncbi:MAG: sigma-70 family RNA polymerase sigma factor [Bifidobacterium longum]|nr:sigma-70 family RNA polymerase sigma factor [Bifidobacterium longum]
MQSGQSAGSGESMAAKRARFEQLAMPAVNALYRQAMRLTNNPDDAQDLVQDTFERGFKAFDSFQPGSNFEAWMTTIERNAYFNQYAKAKRRPQRANDSTGEYDDWDIYDAAEHTSDRLKSAEEEYLDAFAPEEIMAALARLSPERRQVFIDAAIDGKSYQQVADEQGVKIGTVMSRLNRARTQLKRELASYAKERGYVTGSSAGSPSAKLGENVGRIADPGHNGSSEQTVGSNGDTQAVVRHSHVTHTHTPQQSSKLSGKEI